MSTTLFLNRTEEKQNLNLDVDMEQIVHCIDIIIFEDEDEKNVDFNWDDDSKPKRFRLLLITGWDKIG